MNQSQQKMFAYLKSVIEPGCSGFCKHSVKGYCESNIGCDWVEQMFFGRPNLWEGYELDEEKLEKRAIELADRLDAAEIKKVIGRLLENGKNV